MKITFVYAYEGEEWSTPMALANEFRSRDWEVDFVSIGSNRTGVYHDHNLISWLDSNPTTDIVLFMDWGRFDSISLDKSRLPSAYWIQESGDDPQNYKNNSPKSDRFHLTITPDYESYLNYKELGRNVEWITHFADTKVQFPILSEPEYVAVTTRGRGGSQFLDTITQHGDGTIGNKNNMGPDEHTEFLNKGKMVIQHSRWGEITRRIFEGMACGKMVICDRLDKSKKLEELFIDGEDIVYYDNMVDCINKINYYNENDEERERIANNGFKKVLENYTQKQVVDTLIKNYEEWKNSH